MRPCKLDSASMPHTPQTVVTTLAFIRVAASSYITKTLAGGRVKPTLSGWRGVVKLAFDSLYFKTIALSN